MWVQTTYGGWNTGALARSNKFSNKKDRWDTGKKRPLNYPMAHSDSYQVLLANICINADVKLLKAWLKLTLTFQGQM